MVAEQVILGIKQPLISQASVYLMVMGALIASSDDLSFNLLGYTFLMSNNFFTAAQGIVMKQKLVSKVSEWNSFDKVHFIFFKDLNQNGLLFYNSLLILGPMIILAVLTEDMNKVEKNFLNQIFEGIWF